MRYAPRDTPSLQTFFCSGNSAAHWRCQADTHLSAAERALCGWQAFSTFGSVTDANIVYDRETGRSRGFGFVSFDDTDAAKKACNEMDQAEVGGRTVNVNFAKARAPRPEY